MAKPAEFMAPDALREAAGRLQVRLDDGQCERLADFVELVRKWNTRFNLISRRDIGRIWSRHVLDSLSVLPLIRSHLNCAGGRVEALDAGTGAGFPGMPLAIAEPALSWRLLDRNQRKIRFLEQVVSGLQLSNVEPVCMDLAQAAAKLPPVTVVVSRAVDRPPALLARLRSMVSPGGELILLTGASAAAGSGDSDAGLAENELIGAGAVVTRQQIEIPGLDRIHEVTIIRPTHQ